MLFALIYFVRFGRSFSKDKTKLYTKWLKSEQSSEILTFTYFYVYRYGDTVEHEFYLNTFRDRHQLLSAINRIGYRAFGSRRDIGRALLEMRTVQFNASRVRQAVVWTVRIDFHNKHFRTSSYFVRIVSLNQEEKLCILTFYF